MSDEIEFDLHRQVEIDASEGKNLYRVTATSKWIEQEDYFRFMRRAPGVFVVRNGVKNGRDNKE